jgi:acyl carrier protein
MNKCEMIRLEQKLIDILYNFDIHIELDKKDFKPGMSLFRDLSLSSLEVVSYLLAIENELNLNLDYEDITREIFDNFKNVVNYYYEKM